ncbi:MAG: PadR family transcriptional regulator [Candidatus Izimaplasma sp.]|nr:PadR family transcriptional regulator [Candidatus Izimaplasma bacterium]
MPDKTLENLVQELKKGTLVLAVCSQLKDKHYGYSLVDSLNKQGLDIDKNTLYPLLRRLEKRQILDATWSTKSSRPRKYYQLSMYGHKIYKQLRNAYNSMHKQLQCMMEE